MARIFDVVEYPDEMKDEIVHRIPEEGAGDFRIGSQVIVREAQNAVFFRDGKVITSTQVAIRSPRRISHC
jgi:membrane protease subunit (stomatin/prohibitin family)